MLRHKDAGKDLTLSVRDFYSDGTLQSIFYGDRLVAQITDKGEIVLFPLPMEISHAFAEANIPTVIDENGSCYITTRRWGGDTQ